ncbi:MAG: ankyrin repeat domain-containing protein [Alphaproteobacteria bacterium]|nr:ankyrin repeat domain-containing protein [Alphaproteobacteria bacterium]
MNEKFEKFEKLEEIEKQFDVNMDYLEDELKKIDKNDLTQFSAPLQNNEFKAFLIEKNFKTLYNILTPKTCEHYYPANYTLMMAVVSNPYLEVCEKKVLIKRMLELGFSINDRNIYGETALYIATKRGVEDIVLYLLENGADPNISNQLCITPLMIASYNDWIYLSSILIYYGADVGKKCKINNMGLKDISQLNLSLGVENLLTEFKDRF